uniref:Uncharacterized protein n=1 Tax=Arundo donax TaxID=35708 RepID=A0A0A9CG01_ARUDO
MPSYHSERLMKKMDMVVDEKDSSKTLKRNIEGLLKGVSKEDLLKGAKGLIQAVAARAPATRLNQPVARLRYINPADQDDGDRNQEK